MPGGKFPSLLNAGIISTQQYRCVDYSSSSGAQLLSKQPDRLGNRALTPSPAGNTRFKLRKPRTRPKAQAAMTAR
jgi:hypothetical protein